VTKIVVLRGSLNIAVTRDKLAKSSSSLLYLPTEIYSLLALSNTYVDVAGEAGGTSVSRKRPRCENSSHKKFGHGELVLTSCSVEIVLPQALAKHPVRVITYMAANPQPDQATFGLVSNAAYSMFVKLHQSQYSFSEDFSLNRRQNELYNVLRVLNRLKVLS
jgi:hypothetical protein